MRIAHDSYRHSGLAGEFNNLLTKVDIDGCLEPEILSVNTGEWFSDIEHIKVKTVNNDFFNMIYKVENAENISVICNKFSEISAGLIKTLRVANNTGKLILFDTPARIIFEEVKKYNEANELYNISKKDLEKMEEDLKKLRKSDPENSLLEILSKEYMIKKDQLQVLRANASPRTFLSDNFIMGALNLLKGFKINYISERLIMADVKPTFDQHGITSKVIEDISKIIEVSKEKNLTQEDEAELAYHNWIGSDNYSITYDFPKESHHLWVLKTMDDMDPIDVETSIQMGGIKPVANMKTHILASIMASGTLGSSSNEVLVNNEKYLMKSIMLPKEEVTQMILNGQKITEKTSIFKPSMGVFNLLRKEIRILED